MLRSIDFAWFFGTVVILAIGLYVTLDVFDLGLGMLFPLARCGDRNLIMHSLAAMRDGAGALLVLGGLVLPAAFLTAFAIAVRAFYVPIAAMPFGLVIFGKAFEFRLKGGPMAIAWSGAFALASILAALSQGVLRGSLVAANCRDGRSLRWRAIRLDGVVRDRIRSWIGRRLRHAGRGLADLAHRGRGTNLRATHCAPGAAGDRQRDPAGQRLDTPGAAWNRRAVVLLPRHPLSCAAADDRPGLLDTGVALALGIAALVALCRHTEPACERVGGTGGSLWSFILGTLTICEAGSAPATRHLVAGAPK